MSQLKTYFIHIPAKKKSGQKDHVFWASRPTEGRAIRDAINAMEDAGLDEGDFFSPRATNFHVVDDLPGEGVIDNTWCERYQLGDDKLTWMTIPGAQAAVSGEDGQHAEDEKEIIEEAESTFSLESLSPEKVVAAAWLF